MKQLQDSLATQLAQHYKVGSSMSRLLAEAPYFSRCSDNKTAAVIRPRQYAIKYPYMQVNQANLTSWLIFDLDHENANIWDDKNLPEPNLIVRNRKNGHAHLYYAIVPVLTSDDARPAPIRYMKAIYAAMAKQLNADTAYSGPVAKTPGHPWWQTTEIHNKVYELGDLACYLDLEVKPFQKEPDLDSVSHSRHCMLFEHVRHYAYSIAAEAKSHGCFRAFKQDIEDYATGCNNFRQMGFKSDLTLAQVRSTVKSIASWTWDRYTGTGAKNRGVMQLSESLDTKTKQGMSAKRTHDLRKNSTQARISAAYNNLKQSGKTTTIQQVAKTSGLSRQTVAKYKHLLTETKHNSNDVISIRRLFTGKRSNVNYGVHQITAPGGDLGSRFATPSARPPLGGISGDSRPIFRPAQRPPGRLCISRHRITPNLEVFILNALGRSEQSERRVGPAPLGVVKPKKEIKLAEGLIEGGSD